MAKTNTPAETTATDEAQAATGAAPPPPPPSPPPARARGPRLGVGLPVHVCDHESGKVHAAVVTHVNDDRSIIATVFRPNETQAGVGFAEAEHGLATPGRWLWPEWMTGE